MAFPKGGEVLSRSGFRSRVQRARKALDYLAGQGFCEARRDGKGLAHPARQALGGMGRNT